MLPVPALHPDPTPLFTVVMPCFRARETIGVAVRSVLTQTEPSFELLIVDDGSPDDSAAVALAAAAGDPRVRILVQENKGPAAARNHGAADGIGTLVAFLDSDDRWADDLLARHRTRFAMEPCLGVSFARTRFYDAAMAQPGRMSAHVDRLTLSHVLGENPVCTTSNIVARRSVLDSVGGFDLTMKHAEDQEWLVRVLAITAWEIRGIDAALVDYRMSAAGLSADLGAMQAGWEAMIERARGYARAKIGAAEPGARALFHRYLARRALRTGQGSSEALNHMLLALRYSPIALIAGGLRRSLMTAAGALACATLPAGVVRATISR